ncbi:MAG: helix-turn-helix transcriptional regulator [Bacilli bacterium]|nr:helix-turn-helix transcriptional regulator [Bacilli bacterium]
MDFKTALNNYIKKLNCTSKELAIKANLSETVISRYRNGLRTPGVNKDEIKNLANAISVISYEKKINLNYEEVLNCLIDSVNKNDEFNYNNFCKNFNRLLNDLKINIKDMAKYINFDASYISRIRYNKAKPSTPSEFCNKVCSYVINKFNDNDILIKFLNCNKNINDKALFDNLYNFLINNENTITESKYINDFLISLDDFNLNDFIKAIKFDELKVPNILFYKAKTKSYYGIEEMKRGELDFFKATVLSKDTEDIFMCSDMPMEDMADDISFGKKWMFGIAMCLKKGLHLNIIHNLDRPFNEMMLGLESWIPIYMTGSVSPYYLKNYSNNVYNHLNYTSGSVILTGECINSYHNKGKYYLTSNSKEINYYKEKTKLLLKKASPLMEIYTNDNKDVFDEFLKKEKNRKKDMKRLLANLPIFTIDDEILTKMLKRNKLTKDEIKLVLNYKKNMENTTYNILKNNTIEDTIYNNDFNNDEPYLSLENMFFNKNIYYTKDEYLKHLNSTKKYCKSNNNYKLNIIDNKVFNNISITITNNYVIIYKNNNPQIKFVIKHSKLVDAISKFNPLVIEKN